MSNRMDDRLEKLLYEKYPKIFPTPLRWGFECRDGWYELIDELCRRITEYLEKHPTVSSVVVIQVKQKFATLRVHVTGGNKITDQLIDDACRISSNVCEEC